MDIVAIDIGGTAIKSCLMHDGQITGYKETPTDAKEGGKKVVERVAGIISGYPDFKAIGISTTGQVDSEKGSIIFANDNIPDYTGMNIKETLEGIFHVPTAVENDVNSAALGESFQGAAKHVNDFLMLTYGTGVGGAIVIDRQIYHGALCTAAEFGGIIIHPEAIREGVVFSGCYEAYASVNALIKRVQRNHAEIKTGRQIFEHRNDTGIQSEIDGWVEEIAYGLVSLIYIFNPSLILLGGGIMSQEYVLQSIRSQITTKLSGNFKNVIIEQALLGNRAGLTGAAILAENRLMRV